MLQSHTVLWLVTSFLVITVQVEAQGFFGRPSIFNFQAAQLARNYNTACRGDGNESGTCISASDCERKGGTNSGACANGAGACCTFKVSLAHLWNIADPIWV